MGLPSAYTTGTISIANGSKNAVGVGTAFVDAGIQSGDVLWNPDGTASQRVDTVTDNTHFTVVNNWGGASLSGSAYEIRITAPAASIAAAVRSLLTTLTNGVLTTIAGLTQTTGNILQVVSGAWASVDIPTALKSILTSDDYFIQRKSGTVSQRSPAQVAADLQSSLTSAIAGVTDGSSASSGNIGQVVSSSVASGSAISLSTGTAANVTSISLPAGDWDVWGNISYRTPASGVTITQEQFSISTTSATLATAPNNGGQSVWNGSFTASGAGDAALTLNGLTNINVSTTTTVYLVGRGTFSGGSGLTAYGSIVARRRR